MRPNIIPAVAASNKRNKTKKMSSRKLNEHVEEELFNKEKRVIPSVSPEKRVKLNEGVEPKIKKVVPKPPQSEPKVIKEGEQPVKKKKPYYRKKYTKPVEVVITEPVDNHLFIKGLITGLAIAGVITIIINLLT
jgi:hypothetical protein